jgi:hypothetical protein
LGGFVKDTDSKNDKILQVTGKVSPGQTGALEKIISAQT